MQHFDAIVIGGGLGGLSAGAALSRRGKKVLLLEQHHIPGGCATTFKRKDFVMEASLHAMDGHLVSDENQRSLLKHLGIKDKVQFIPVPEFFHIQGKNIDFTFPNGIDEAIKTLTKVFPDEERGIRIFFSTIIGVQRELSAFPRSFWAKALKFPLFPFYFPRIFRTFNKTVGSFLDKHISSNELKLILQGNLLYYSDDPYNMSMVFFAKAQASFIHYGGYFINGGSQKLSDALAEVIRENGGNILFGKKAEGILIENGKASGVHVGDTYNKALEKQTIKADHIIHSGAVPLVKDLLPEKERRKIARRLDRLVPATSLLTVYIGFKGNIRPLKNAHYSNFFYEQVTALSDVRSGLHGDWHTRPFVFVDYSQVDSGLAPDGKSFGAICTADALEEYEGLDESCYQTRKEEIASILIGRLEKEIPGISALIETYEVGTARTIRRYTLNPAGAPYGYAQTLKQVGWKRPAYKSPVEGLWFSGNWTFPGGGFTGAVVSGLLCAIKVEKALGNTPLITGDFVMNDPRRVKLISSAEVARNTLELVFEKPPGFHFQPGQYVILTLDNPAYTALDMPFRSMSVASFPSEESLRFIMRMSSSSFKRSCVAMKPGDTAIIYGPIGDFTLKKKEKGLVFLSSGIGITPVLSFLKELEKEGFRQPVYLFSSNRTEDSAVDHQWLQSIGLPDYHYIPVFTGTEGRMDSGRLKNALKDPLLFDYYVVGGRDFLKDMKSILTELGIPEDYIRQDDFG